MPKILKITELPKAIKPITEKAITRTLPIVSLLRVNITMAPMITITAQRTSIAPKVPKSTPENHTGAVGRRSSMLPQPYEGLIALSMAPMPQNRLRMPADSETANPNTALLGSTAAISFSLHQRSV